MKDNVQVLIDELKEVSRKKEICEKEFKQTESLYHNIIGKLIGLIFVTKRPLNTAHEPINFFSIRKKIVEDRDLFTLMMGISESIGPAERNLIVLLESIDEEFEIIDVLNPADVLAKTVDSIVKDYTLLGEAKSPEIEKEPANGQ